MESSLRNRSKVGFQKIKCVEWFEGNRGKLHPVNVNGLDAIRFRGEWGRGSTTS